MPLPFHSSSFVTLVFVCLHLRAGTSSDNSFLIIKAYYREIVNDYNAHSQPNTYFQTNFSHSLSFGRRSGRTEVESHFYFILFIHYFITGDKFIPLSTKLSHCHSSSRCKYRFRNGIEVVVVSSY